MDGGETAQPREEPGRVILEEERPGLFHPRIMVVGRVVAANTSMPIPGASVEARERTLYDVLPAIGANSARRAERAASLTGPDGAFELKGFVEGERIRVVVQAEGYGGEAREISLEGERTDLGTVALQPFGRLELQVTDLLGRAIPGSFVLAFSRREGFIPSGGVDWLAFLPRSIPVDPEGRVSLALPPGPYSVAGIARGYASVLLDLEMPAEGIQILRLPEGHDLFVSVTGPDGLPLADAKVWAGIRGGPWWPQSRTDGAGRAWLGGFPAGQKLSVSAVHPEFSPKSTEVVLSGPLEVPIRLDRPSRARILVKIEWPDPPPEGPFQLALRLQSKVHDSPVDATQVEPGTPEVTLLTNVSRSCQAVLFSPALGHIMGPPCQPAMGVVTETAIRVPAGRSGIQILGTAVGPDGSPAGHALVVLHVPNESHPWPSGSNPFWGRPAWQPLTWVRADEGGSFRLNVFVAGSILLSGKHPRLGMGRVALNIALPRLEESVRLELGGSGIIQGRISGLLPGQLETARIRLEEEDGLFRSTTALDQEGRYEFQGLPPGEWRLMPLLPGESKEIIARAMRFAVDPSFGGSSRGRVVHLPPAGKLRVDFDIAEFRQLCRLQVRVNGLPEDCSATLVLSHTGDGSHGLWEGLRGAFMEQSLPKEIRLPVPLDRIVLARELWPGRYRLRLLDGQGRLLGGDEAFLVQGDERGLDLHLNLARLELVLSEHMASTRQAIRLVPVGGGGPGSTPDGEEGRVRIFTRIPAGTYRLEVQRGEAWEEAAPRIVVAAPSTRLELD